MSAVSELRAACERLYVLGLQVEESSRLLEEERRALADEQSCYDALKRDMEGNACLPHASSMYHVQLQEEVDMLQRLMREESASLSTVEKSLEALEILSEKEQKELRNTQSQVAKLRAERHSLELYATKKDAEAKRLTSEVATLQRSVSQLAHRERMRIDHFIDLDLGASRQRAEAQFAERARRSTEENVQQLQQWKLALEKQHEALLNLASGLAEGETNQAVTPTGKNATAGDVRVMDDLRSATGRSLAALIASLRQLHSTFLTSGSSEPCSA